jgi:hypothetical protein
MVEFSPAATIRAMKLTTILNRCHRFPGFVSQHARFSSDKKSIEISVQPAPPDCDQLAERLASQETDEFVTHPLGKLPQPESTDDFFWRARKISTLL